MAVRIGTSGYNYPEWRGTFYPEKFPAGKMLPYSAERFSTVEINYTFYRMPSAKTIAGWDAETPPGFRFTLKAPQRITHFARLRDVGDPLRYFCDVARALGDKLGPLLFQLPPFFKKDLAVLGDFLEHLPPGRQIAFEFRNLSWDDEAVYDMLRARGAMLCIADTDKGDPPPLVATAGMGYLRLRREAYSDADLKDWVKRVAAQPWTRAYVYFKHEDEAAGPRFAARFAGLWEATRGPAKAAR